MLSLVAGACLVVAGAAAQTPTAPVPSSAQPPAQAAAAPPPTDVYLATLESRDGRLVVGTPSNISMHPGYDNQPSFLPDGTALFFTSNRGGAQTDIYRYDFANKAIARVTDTPESEYSPTVTPAGNAFSVIRVEADSAQRLWQFDLDGPPSPSASARLVLADVKSVGYHVWADASTLVLFVLGQPPTLQIADTKTGRAEVVASQIGRSLHRIPGRSTVSFVQKETLPAAEAAAMSSGWWVKELDPRTRTITPLVRTLEGKEDCAWTPDAQLLMGSGSKVYRWKVGAAEWEEVADLSAAGITNITRLAVSPRGDWLALVSEPTPAR